ncbi:MAG: hypothetical protein ABIW33_06105 [Sphingomicrobium sp.]
MSDRQLGQARRFLGVIVLVAAVVTWAMGLMMSPHETVASTGVDHVRGVIVTFARKSAIGTMVLSALSAWLLFPQSRPRNPRRDYALMALLAVMVVTSLYQMYWLSSVG